MVPVMDSTRNQFERAEDSVSAILRSVGVWRVWTPGVDFAIDEGKPVGSDIKVAESIHNSDVRLLRDSNILAWWESLEWEMS
jgi:hypothetical protein